MRDPLRLYSTGKENRPAGVSSVRDHWSRIFYEMDPEVSKQIVNGTRDELKYMLENGEPEEV